MRLTRPGWTYEDTAADLMVVLQGSESCGPVTDAELKPPVLVELYRRLTDVARPDGSWPGADAAETVRDVLQKAGYPV